MIGNVFDIKRFALHDGPGIRTTVFLKGCPLRCWWCHNPESQKSQQEIQITNITLDGKSFERRKEIGKTMTVDNIMQQLDKESVFYNESGGGVTISGGEPLMQPKFLNNLLMQCKTHGYHTAVDTCGFASRESYESIIPHTDLFLYDLKHMDNETHKKFTGKENHLILENLKFLVSLNCEVIIRIPLIPGINDQEKHIEDTVEFLKKLKKIKEVHLLPFHNLAAHKYKRLEKEIKLPESAKYDEAGSRVIENRFIENGFLTQIGG